MCFYTISREEREHLRLEREERHQQEEEQHLEEEKRRQEADCLLSSQQKCVTSDQKDSRFIHLLSSNVLQYKVSAL